MLWRASPSAPNWWSSLTAVLLASAQAAVAQTSTKDLGTILGENKNLTTYYSLLKQYPNILLQLPNYAGITIVAPNNDAFTKFQGWDPKNETLVTNMLEYHILQGTVSTDAIPEGPTAFASTLLADTRYTNVTGGQRVLIDKQPGNVVVFTSGAGSRSTLVEGDIGFQGGLVQVVDALMVPPLRLEPTMRDSYQDLVAFLAALYAADLVPSFAESADVTIFAPRNAAFQLLAGTLSALPKAELARVLSYHLVPGHVLLVPQLTNGTNLTTAATDAAGRPVPARLLRAGNNMYVDAAQVIQPDILVANGVVHMIGSVLNPDAPAAAPNPDLGTQAPAFPLTGATSTGSRAATPFTTALPCTVSCPVPTTAAATAAATEAAGGAEVTSSSTSLRTTSSEGGAARGPGVAMATGFAGVGGAAAAGLGLLGVAVGMVGVA